MGTKIKAGVQKCILEFKIDCFSNRENIALTNLLKAVHKNGKESWATDTGKNMMKEMDPNGRKILKCALGMEEKKTVGSGQPSGSMYSTLVLQILNVFLCFFILPY